MKRATEHDSIEESFDKKILLRYNTLIRRRETAYKRKGNTYGLLEPDL